MMVNDFDDEQTLEEEEATGEENADEIDELQRVSLISPSRLVWFASLYYCIFRRERCLSRNC